MICIIIYIYCIILFIYKVYTVHEYKYAHVYLNRYSIDNDMEPINWLLGSFPGRPSHANGDDG